MRYVDGRVCAIDGALASVELTVHEGGCGRCHEAGGCGGQNITRALCGKTKKIIVPNTLNAVVGDVVRVGVEEQALRAIATRVYVFPFLGLIVGAAIGDRLFASADSTGGIVGGVVGFLLVLALSASRRTASSLRPRMIDRGEPELPGHQ